MGIFNRKIQQKALQIDLRRWSTVEEFLGADEEPLHNTPCRYLFAEGIELGTLFLTDQALICSIDEGASVLRLTFDEIKLVSPKGRNVFRIGYVPTGGEPTATDVELYPSPLSQELWAELISRLEIAHGSR